MGKIITKIEKTFDTDKVGRTLAYSFEKLSRESGKYVDTFNWGDKYTVVTEEVTTYGEEDDEEGDEV